jgi:hypothetical protein
MNNCHKIYSSIIFSFTLIILSGGCNSTSNSSSNWIGKQDSELIAAWGEPDNTITLQDGRKILSWDIYNNPSQVVPCRQSFTISADGKVEDFTTSNCAPRQFIPANQGRNRFFRSQIVY